jgi:hypothetical protein
LSDNPSPRESTTATVADLTTINTTDVETPPTKPVDSNNSERNGKDTADMELDVMVTQVDIENKKCVNNAMLLCQHGKLSFAVLKDCKRISKVGANDSF